MPRSTRPLVEKFLERTEKTASCWIWHGAGAGHYGVMWNPDLGRNDKAHRISYILFTGPIPAGMHVCHRCDNPSCVNPAHLFLGSRSDNMQDARRKGRTAAGEKAGAARLTWNQVRSIRATDPRTEEEIEAVAKQFGVGRRTVFRILLRETWQDATNESSTWVPMAHPNPFQLLRVEPGTAEVMESEGWLHVPDALLPAARKVLSRNDSRTISRRSMGALSKWLRSEVRKTVNILSEKAKNRTRLPNGSFAPNGTAVTSSTDENKKARDYAGK